MSELKTPYFVINKQILDSYWNLLETSLAKSWGNYRIGYSFKTNSLPWLVTYLKRKGAFAEVVSDDEYKLAKYLSFADSEIIYNGPYKEFDSFNNVLQASGIVNLDSFREIEWLEKISRQNPNKLFSVGIRVNFDLEKMCPGETTMGEKSGRFGFCYETGKFHEAIMRINNLTNIQIRGVHLHSSSKSRSVNIFKSIANMACKLQKEFSLSLDYLDFGGGYCGGIANKPEYPDYFTAISEILKDNFDPQKTKIIVEPGISLISKCTTFVTSIFDVRDIKGTRYIMTDGSRFNVDPTMIKNSYFYHIDYKDCNERKVKNEQIISGFSCMEADRLFELKEGKELFPGDKIIYENVGGYTMSLNPLFIQYFPPVYIFDNNEYICVRKKWTPEYYAAGSEWGQE